LEEKEVLFVVGSSRGCEGVLPGEEHNEITCASDESSSSSTIGPFEALKVLLLLSSTFLLDALRFKIATALLPRAKDKE
jgi:hypothetical protein